MSNQNITLCVCVHARTHVHVCMCVCVHVCVGVNTQFSMMTVYLCGVRGQSEPSHPHGVSIDQSTCHSHCQLS